ncbi:MAG: hypothetical protein GC192_17365 [Bacteroidetes bacterium]|nr:hypothetical protein [Bacteroidota bacterium]
MAKKTASLQVAATATAPKSTKKVLNSLPCALKYYWQYALLAWGYCRENLAQFAVERPYFTEAFIDDQVALVYSTEALPNNATRRSLSKEQGITLKANRQIVFDEGQKLGLAIDYAYRFEPKEVAQVQRTAAGLDALSAASPTNWGDVAIFITAGKNYLTANNDMLVAAGAINADFSTNFTAVGDAFNTIWDGVLLQRKKAKDGTQAVVDGIELIKKELNPMLKLGSETIFKYDPIKRDLFTIDRLVASVKSHYPAKVLGRTNSTTTELPIGGVLVEVLYMPDKTAITDAKGRYEIQLAAGTYTLRFTSYGTVPFEQVVLLDAGVGRRVNVLLSPMEAAQTASKEVTPPPATMNEVLANAMKEVAAVPTNGQVASENGHAVA